MEADNILDQPVGQLPLSPRCIAYLKKKGFTTLRGVTLSGWQGLRGFKDFDYLSFNELVRFLDRHQLVHLMESKA